MRKRLSLLALLVLTVSTGAFADTAAQKPYIDFGNTAWLIVATAFVLMMTIPGLAFFYGGLVRRKNVLSVVMQTFVITAVVSLQWVIVGYSLSFGSSHGALAPFIGGFKWVFLNGIGVNDVSPYAISQATARVPHLIFIMFQCMFAVITPALILGAFAERIKFSGFVLFTLLWATFVYDPVAHWVWSTDGWLAKLGALDFAGGTVVHVNSGVAALVTALLIGRRRLPTEGATPPHNVPFVALGAALLWVGWFGFNAGSGVAADGLASNAFLVTHIAACAALLSWMLMDIIFNGKATVVGAATGAVAGLVAITPASGFVNVFGAIIIGIVVSVVCFLAVAFLKPKFGYDDALDAFGVHGIGGMWGSLGTGLFAVAAVGGASGVVYGNPHQILPQLADIGATLVWSGIGTLITFKVADWLVGVRVTERQEDIGLDLSQHNEKAYTVIE
jgi:Amt family ammonium transporter